jgi:molybdenum cofactor synthesis domain-containing protein
VIGGKQGSTKFDLLRKTELRIENVRLENANLTDIAACAANVLGIGRNDVLVVDYRDEALTLDILNSCINAHHIVGKKEVLFKALGMVSGVTVSGETALRSDGMLGWIALDEAPAKQALAKSEQMISQILENISKRAIVFSSGAEVERKQIQDTNTPAVIRRLEAEGYTVTRGETLKDDRVYISAKLRETADYGGYGLIVTTGGVGAEDKDHTVEAVTALDPEAATPYICHFKIGTGRHVKDGIRIAVGEYNGTMIIALPGPNDEVVTSMEVVAEGLKKTLGKAELAENIAGRLRAVLAEKMVHY